MPKKLEHELAKEASKKHLTGDRKNAYIYGTLAKIKKAREGKR